MNIRKLTIDEETMAIIRELITDDDEEFEHVAVVLAILRDTHLLRRQTALRTAVLALGEVGLKNPAVFDDDESMTYFTEVMAKLVESIVERGAQPLAAVGDA